MKDRDVRGARAQVWGARAWTLALAAALSLSLVACADDAASPEAESLAPIGPLGPCDAIMTPVPAGAYSHIGADELAEYEGVPPVSGSHRGQWYAWGEYAEAVPPEHYVHNLEHGGMAFFYGCDAPCDELVDSLRTLVTGVADDDGGAFRYILAPYPGLPSLVAAAAWEWRYEASCFDAETLGAFIADHYRQAPEDVASDGSMP